MIRIGIDVGGTNTDAVVMDGAKVLAGVKAATTGDVMSGVVAALKAVLEAAKLDAERHRRRDDRHHPFHQRRRAAPRSRADRRRPARPAGDRLAAADGRLARRPEGGDRRPLLSGARRPRIRRPRDLAARRRRSCSASPPTSGPKASAPSRSPRCSARSTPSARRARRDILAEGAARTCISRCRATSAASDCWSARTRRS